MSAEVAATFLGVSTPCLTLASSHCPWLMRRSHGNQVLYSAERVALLQAMLNAGAIGWEIFSKKATAAQSRSATPRNAQDTSDEETVQDG